MAFKTISTKRWRKVTVTTPDQVLSFVSIAAAVRGLGTTRSILSKWLTGKRPPKGFELARVEAEPGHRRTWVQPARMAPGRPKTTVERREMSEKNGGRAVQVVAGNGVVSVFASRREASLALGIPLTTLKRRCEGAKPRPYNSIVPLDWEFSWI